MTFVELSGALHAVCACCNLGLSDTTALWNAIGNATDFLATDNGSATAGRYRLTWGELTQDAELPLPPEATAYVWTREGVERGLLLKTSVQLAAGTRYLILRDV